jgi:UDP:flavonoid glycosyltransferase YjiC (YdhE family)
MNNTLLFAPETFNIAETTRMLEIARAVSSDFECHFMGYGGEFERLIKETGFPFHPLQPQLTPKRIKELWKADRMELGGRIFTPEELTQRVRSELALYEQIQPAAIVIGFTLSVYISARAAGIPLVAAAPLAFTRPFFEAGLGVFPGELDLPPLRWLPETLKDGWFNRWGLKTSLFTGLFNSVAQQFGVPPWNHLVDIFEADEMLITGIPELTGLTQLPPHWHYIGPIFARLSGEVPPDILDLTGKRPLIYFAMGSSANASVLRKVLTILSDLPYQVVAPVKYHLAGKEQQVPAHIHLFDWLPAHLVNPLADLAIIHGGEGTVQTACWSGTPFVGIGLQPEQDANIDFMVKQGMAIRLPKYGVNHKKLSQAIETILHEPSYKEQAQQVQVLMKQWNGAENAAAFLKQHYLKQD